MKIKKFNEHLKKDDKIITTTYQVVTEESAEQGDYADTGWYDEEGESMIPDKYDIEEGVTIVDKAVDFLENTRYTTETSSNQFHKGIYYLSSDPDINYTTGEETFYNCHLEGFTEEEEQLIFLKIKDIDKYNEWKESGMDYENFKNMGKDVKKYNL